MDTSNDRAKIIQAAYALERLVYETTTSTELQAIAHEASEMVRRNIYRVKSTP